MKKYSSKTGLNPTKNKFQKKGSTKKRKGFRDMTAEVVGDQVLNLITKMGTATRPEYVKRVWDYINLHDLHRGHKGKRVVPDEVVDLLLGHKGQEVNGRVLMAKCIEKHLVKKPKNMKT